MLIFLFTGVALISCSMNDGAEVLPEEKSVISFEMLGDVPQCGDKVASYVEVVLTNGEGYVIGGNSPYRIPLVSGQLFTEEDPALALKAGMYSLEHFAVYDDSANLLWIAPKGGNMKQLVDTPLPLGIDLRAGVKKYVSVSVLCYKERNGSEYGYVFLKSLPIKALKYCFFANYCLPNERHFPARYSVEFSVEGEVIYEAEQNINEVGTNEFGDVYANPLCFALPNLARFADDEEYLDYTVRLLDWEGVYEAPENSVITGSLSRNEILENYDGNHNLFYEHLRFGCDEDVQTDNKT